MWLRVAYFFSGNHLDLHIVVGMTSKRISLEGTCQL